MAEHVQIMGRECVMFPKQNSIEFLLWLRLQKTCCRCCGGSGHHALPLLGMLFVSLCHTCEGTGMVHYICDN